MRYHYNKKMIKSGDIIELYEYEIPVLVGGNKSANGGRHHECLDELEKERHRETAIRRTRKEIMRSVNCNVTDRSSFLTLTFADNVQDLKAANSEFNKFMKRLRYHYPLKLHYLAVWERQKRGAIHYHVILFDVPKLNLRALNKIWGQGWVKVNKIKNIDNVGAYICKYLGKDLDEGEKGQRRYFTSRGLKKSEIITDLNFSLTKKIDEVASDNSACIVFQSQFETEYYGLINYTQFNLKRQSQRLYNEKKHRE